MNQTPFDLIDFLEQIGQITAEEKQQMRQQNTAPEPASISSYLKKPTHLIEEAERWSKKYPFQPVDLNRIDQNLVYQLPEDLLVQGRLLPMAIEKGVIQLGVVNPKLVSLISRARSKLKRPVRCYLIDAKDWQTVMRNYFGLSYKLKQLQNRLTLFLNSEQDITHNWLAKEPSSGPVSELVELLIAEAITQHVSDLHIEHRYTETMIIRARVDNDLKIWGELNTEIGNALTRRLIIIAGADITETRKPVEGSFSIQHGTHIQPCRLSIVATEIGVSIVVRLLGSLGRYSTFESLNIEQNTQTQLKTFLNYGSGLLLVSGPTSSGKTTLLYGCTSYLKQKEMKIITIEDPVEVNITGVTQLPVKADLGLDFQALLRAVTRQNPDVLVIGEIRDQKTAQSALQASLSYRMVLATVHARDVVTTVSRMIDFGLDATLFAAGIGLITSTKLLRKLCQACRRSRELTAEEKGSLLQCGVEAALLDFLIYDAKGCDQCAQTGFQSRQAIYETLNLTEAMRQLLMRQDIATFHWQCQTQLKGRDFLHQALTLAKDGLISMQELRLFIST